MANNKQIALPTAFGAFLFIVQTVVWAATTGTISGTLTDPSGAVIPGATVIATNTAQGVMNKTTTDAKGIYTFPSLPVGTYDLKVEQVGFKPKNRNGLEIDIDSALQIDMTVEMAERIEEVTVLEREIQVDIASSQMGEVVTGRAMTAVALNGRSFTDLLALQPGIVPTSTQQPDSIVMAGVTVAIAPSGVLNAGNQSIGGQREDANGFMVNGSDVKELMNGGTLVVPNLDSIAEFRILTNNFDAEYGNYSGGVVNVVTKSGANALHGSGFEFLRNTALDSRNFFSPERSFYRQNQFGGTVGGPIQQNKLFYFGDYQGTRTSQGIDTGLIPVPSAANRTGNLSDQADSLTGSVSGPYLANLLSGRLGYGVSADEPYYTPGCASPSVRFPECDHSAACLVGAIQESFEVHSGAQPRGERFLQRLARQDTARRQGEFPGGRQQPALGTDFGLLLSGRLPPGQSLSAGSGRSQRARFQRSEPGPRPALHSRSNQDFRRFHGERASLERHAKFEQRRPTNRRRWPQAG
jgi:hypothetical protein